MRFESIRITNFRLHSDLTVDFDERCTLVSGPNESGKSTLFDAIHSALFMGHRKGGALLDGIRPRSGGTPEVEVVFHARGKRWTLRKRFAGSSTQSLCVLSNDRGETWKDDTAEKELRSLVNVDAAFGGDGSAMQLRANAAHLWVWQGTSGDEAAVSEQLNDKHNQLVERLGSAGVAGIMQSSTDARIAEAVRKEREQTLKEGNQPRAGTPLATAKARVAELREQRSRAETEVTEREAAANGLADALKAQQDARRELARLEPEQAKHEESIEQDEQLAEELRKVCRDRDDARVSLQAVEEADEGVRASRDELAREDKAVAPLTEKLTASRANRVQTESERAEARATLEESDRALCALRLRSALMEAWGTFMRLEREREQELGIAHELEALKTQTQPKRAELASLPRVDHATVAEIDRLQAALAIANERCHAASARVELLETSVHVSIDGAPLDREVPHLVAQVSELKVGSVARLRIVPAGGESLETLQQQSRNAQAALDSVLRAASVVSPEQARTLAIRRAELEGLIKEADARGQALDARSSRSVAEIEVDLAACNAELRRRADELAAQSATPPDLARPDTPEAAGQALKEFGALLRSAEASHRDLAVHETALNQRALALQGEIERTERDLAERSRRGDMLRAQIDVLERQWGDNEARDSKRREAEKQYAQLQRTIERLESERRALRADFARSERVRIGQLIARNRDRESSAAVTIQVSRKGLQSDGSRDPRQVLLELEEAVRGAEARESAEQRSADAIRLLDDLFDEARKQADQTLANAIESHIDPYLQCVFGEAASARVARDERDGYSIALYRPQQGAEDFKSLSGGTKEQLATAVRLATAEILAPAFDGCLPIGLDDAFTNTDPERVRKLASMLFLASDRGLQVIIGTCQPEDYVDVPGKTVSMRPPRTQVAPSAREAVREEPAASIDRRVLEVGVEPKSPSGASSSDCEAFLAALQGLGGSSGNKSLRESLSWDEARYDHVKEQLLEAQRISLGRGRGGSVSLRGPL